MKDFIHLHVHTYYSILDGQSSIERLVDKALADGMKGMAITDHGNMFGVKELFDYCGKVNKKLKAKDLPPFKPIFGCEMYVARRSKSDRQKDMGDMGGYHLIVLAKNKQGYKNLIKLVSNAWTDGFYSKPRTDREDLEKYREGLIVCSACIAGEVPSKIIDGDIQGAREAIEWHKKTFGDDYYLEIQRHEVKDPPTVRANRDTFPLQQVANKVILELAKEYGIKVVCTNDAHFVDKDDAEAHDHLLCISTDKKLDDPSRMLYSKQEWFKTRAEMNEVFADCPEALENTLDVLGKVELYDIEHDPIMPYFPIPESFGSESEWREKFTEEELFREFTSDENGQNPLPRDEAEKKIGKLGGIEKLYRIKLEADYLAELTYKGAEKLYPTPLSDELKERINFELHIMKTMGFPGYFLIVQDFINTARDSLGVVVGPGRGSAAGSVVAYCLGITRIDPLKYDLLFERFLNPDRISLPDIDTDFDDDGRDRVLEWVENKYGYDNCAHIITYSTMATKNSIKDVARVEQLPLEKSNQLCKLIPYRLPDGMKMNLRNAIKCVPELREAETSSDPKLRNTMEYAKRLEGTVRGTGIHACGFIICRDPISDWVPVSVAEDKSNPGHKLRCTQYDGHVIESTGLIKMDFLGLTTLSIIKEAVENIWITKGKKLDIDAIPIDDPETYRLYSEGRTVGTFQFESSGMQKYLRELKPTTFEDIIAMNALYRPGPMDYIPSFIARKNGKEKISYDIPCMEKYLKDTYGITVYQEQVMLLSRQLANFTRGESDALRKAMGKKKKDIVDSMRPKFIEGGKKNGHDPKVLEKIWSDWEKFASYAFNKSHATCYSWVAYQTAYLKAHYPAEYMSAVMSRSLDDIDEITKLMDECRSMGIPTLGPDVNESRQKFSPGHAGEIRFGISAIKSVGGAAADSIVSERDANGPYKDIFDFVKRVNLSNVNKKSFEALALSGAFDGLGIKREDFFAVNAKGEPFIDVLIRFGQQCQNEKAQQSMSLFGDIGGLEIPNPRIPQGESWSNIEKLKREREYVGIFLSAHPLDEFKVVLDNLCNTSCPEVSDIQGLTGKQSIVLGGIVTATRNKYTKTGKPYGVVTIEDFSGSGELFLYGEEWGRWSGMLRENSPVYIVARRQQRFRDSDLYELKIQNIEYLQTVKERDIERITIAIRVEELNENNMRELTEMLSEQKGNTDVFVQLVDTTNRYYILLRSGNHKINVDNKLISYLEGEPAFDYKIN